MGLCIHYKGRFNPFSSLTELIEEVKDIAEINKWEYHVFDDVFPENHLGKSEFNDRIYGICFSPPKCEPVWLSFLSNGRMSCPPHLQFWGKTDNPEQKDFLYTLATKTQYAGVEAHIFIISFMKYLKEKYLLEFTMIDEGKFWETGDKELLTEIFGRYTQLTDGFGTALQTTPILIGEDLENFIKRIAEGKQEKGED